MNAHRWDPEMRSGSVAGRRSVRHRPTSAGFRPVHRNAGYAPACRGGRWLRGGAPGYRKRRDPHTGMGFGIRGSWLQHSGLPRHLRRGRSRPRRLSSRGRARAMDQDGGRAGSFRPRRPGFCTSHWGIAARDRCQLQLRERRRRSDVCGRAGRAWGGASRGIRRDSHDDISVVRWRADRLVGSERTMPNI